MAHDLSRSRAILIGNGNFADRKRLPDLPAAGCVSAMADLLAGELCGWPADRIVMLPDIASPSDLARRIVPTVRDVHGVLLVYYVGHGVRTSEGQLALALGETDAGLEALPHTAMLYENLAKILRGSPAATKLVILDCCHAELGNKANFQSADLAETYPVDGLYFIGASKTHEKAKFDTYGDLTYFTEAFIDTVRGGLPGLPEELRLDQVFLALRARLIADGLPEPVDAGTRGARQYPFARNAFLQATPAPAAPPDHAREARLRILGQAESILTLAESILTIERPNPFLRRGRMGTDVERRSVALLHLAAALARDDADHARKVMKQAMRLASGAQLTPDEVSSVAQAVAALDPGRAERMVEAITDPKDRDRARITLSMALANIAPDRAETVAHLVNDQDRQARALIHLVSQLAATNPQDAERIADSITRPGERADALMLVAEEIAPSDPRLAQQIARKVIDLRLEPYGLPNVVRELAKADPAGAEGIARALVSQKIRESALARVAMKVADADPGHAERLATEIQDPGIRMWAEVAAACGYSRTDPDRAERIARAITRERADCLTDVAGSLVDSAPGHARRLLQEAQQAATTLDREERYRALAKIVYVAARLDADFGLRIAKRVTDPAERVSALGSVAWQVASTDPGRAAQIARSLASESAAQPYARVQAALIAARLMAKDSPAEARQFLAEAHDPARRVSDLQKRALALADLGTEMAAYDPRHAWRLIDEAEAVAHTVPGSYNRGTAADDTLAKIVGGIIGHHDDAARQVLSHHAERIARTMSGYPSQVNTLNNLARSVFADDPDRAERIVLAMNGAGDQAAALIKIAAMHTDSP